MLSTDCTASRHVGKWLASSLSLPSALVYFPGDAQLISNEANIYKQDGTSAGGSRSSSSRVGHPPNEFVDAPYFIPDDGCGANQSLTTPFNWL